jgi:thiamine-phosphate pyrophosphorylase
MKLVNWRLYVVTPEIKNYPPSEAGLLRRTGRFQIPNYTRSVEEAIIGGAEVIQFRAKKLTDREYYQIGKNLRSLTKKYNIPLIVNNRLDLALAISADGLHLGQEDLSVLEVKKLLTLHFKPYTDFVVGVSTHNLKQAVQAEKDGADYISIGPIFSTPLKPKYKPLGLEIISEVKKKVKIPFFAIGGINQDNLQEVISAGAERIAVIRAVFGQKNIRQRTKELKDLLVSKKEKRKFK